MEAWEIAADQLLKEMAAREWTKENIIAEISNRAANFSAELDSGKTYVFDTIHGSHVVGLSDFLRGDGSIGQVGEIFLDVDQMNTTWTGPEITDHAAVAALPDLKGFGQLTTFKKVRSERWVI